VLPSVELSLRALQRVVGGAGRQSEPPGGLAGRPAAQCVSERSALELAELAGFVSEVAQSIASDELSVRILAIRQSGRGLLGRLSSRRLTERLVLGPPRRGERGCELAGDAQLGERPEARAASAAVEAHRLHEADARLLRDVVLVAARQVEARGLSVEQALVAAQQSLERELVTSLCGVDQGGLDPQRPAGFATGLVSAGVRAFIRRG